LLWIQADRDRATLLVPMPQIVSRAERAIVKKQRLVLVIALTPFLELVRLISSQLATRNIASMKRAPRPPYAQRFEPWAASPISLKPQQPYGDCTAVPLINWSMGVKAAIYARVSTADQNPELLLFCRTTGHQQSCAHIWTPASVKPCYAAALFRTLRGPPAISNRYEDAVMSEHQAMS
jgi:hypothetical protein